MLALDNEFAVQRNRQTRVPYGKKFTKAILQKYQLNNEALNDESNKRTEYNMDDELYDLRSIFLLMVKSRLDKRTRDKIGVFPHTLY